MENIDKILELLQKKSLSDEESRFLKESAQADTELGSIINIYNNLNAKLSESTHVHTDLLSSYILY